MILPRVVCLFLVVLPPAVVSDDRSSGRSGNSAFDLMNSLIGSYVNIFGPSRNSGSRNLNNNVPSSAEDDGCHTGILKIGKESVRLYGVAIFGVS